MQFPQLPPRLLMAVAIGDLSYVKKFVDEGDDINVSGIGGITPLQAAIEGGHAPIVKYLLQKGANVPSVDELPVIENESVRRIVDTYREWKTNKKGFAEFSAAVQTPSLSSSASPTAMLNRDVVGNIGSFLRPSGTAPKGRARTSGKGRRIRKQTRRRK